MHIAALRIALFTGIVIVGLCSSANAQTGNGTRPTGGFPPIPSEPKPLSKDVAAPRVGDNFASAERARLLARLEELIRKINERPAGAGIERPATAGNGVPKSLGPTPKPKFDFPDTGKPIDGVRVAMNLYRDNDFEGSLRAFRLIDPSKLGREDRAFVQYMTACCLRQLNRLGDAAALYREVADAHDDDFITECAVAQLGLIRSAHDLSAQLEQLRSRPKSR